jgi:ABC-2 type transport system permease protein
VRSSATSIGVILGLLYLLPIVSQVIGDPHWQRLLQQIGPVNVGLTIQATTDLHSLPLRSWVGLGVTAGWVAAALVAGGLLLRTRDASSVLGVFRSSMGPPGEPDLRIGSCPQWTDT